MNRQSVWVIIALVVSACSGLVVTLLAFRTMPSAEYARFSVFWGWLYFAVGGFAGIQQEVARATQVNLTRSSASGWKTLVRALRPLMIGLVVLFAGLAVVFRGDWVAIVALALGVLGYLFVALICGVLYGTSGWVAVALMIGLDGVLRLLLIAAAAALGTSIGGFQVAAVTPFVVMPFAFWLLGRRARVGGFSFDVSNRTLLTNATKLIVAAGATAMLISGFQALMSLMPLDFSAAEFGQAAFLIMMARAPLVVAVIAVQSLLIVWLRAVDFGAQIRRLTLVVAAILVAGALEFIVLQFWGPELLAWVKGQFDVVLPRELFGVVAVSGTAMALLFACGSLLVVRSRHGAYLISWGLTLAATIACLAAPGDHWLRLGLALSAAPALGLVFQFAALLIPQLWDQRSVKGRS